MSDVHVSPELLASVLRGDLPPRTLVALVRHHLGELCPECRMAFETVEGEAPELRALSRRKDAGGTSYHDAFHRATCSALREADRMEADRQRAEQDLKVLLALPPEARRGRVERAHKRFRGRTLAELLLEESTRRVRNDPAEAGNLAGLVEEVLARTPGMVPTSWSESLVARARAHRANALRVAGDLVVADGLFRRLRARLGSFPVDDVAVHAEICSLEASLRQAQGRAEEAEVLLERAVLLYRQARQAAGVARTLIQKATLRLTDGDALSALDCLERVPGLIDPEAEPGLFLCTVSNWAVCLCELERYEEAAAVLDDHREHFEGAADGWFRVRLTWTRGRILHGLGADSPAERLLLEARDAFLTADNDFNAALVSLDLALLYLEQGRCAELKELTAGIGAAFEARQLPRHTLSALILFQQAVAQERVTMEVVRELRGLLLSRSLQPAREDMPMPYDGVPLESSSAH